jgi:putative flippase GtrA
MIGIDWQAEAISHAIGIAAGAVSNYFGHKQFSFARH